jgi:hypothetical protein
VGLPMEALAEALKEFGETGKRTGGLAIPQTRERRGDKPETGEKPAQATKKQAGAPPAL